MSNLEPAALCDYYRKDALAFLFLVQSSGAIPKFSVI